MHEDKREGKTDTGFMILILVTMGLLITSALSVLFL